MPRSQRRKKAVSQGGSGRSGRVGESVVVLVCGAIARTGPLHWGCGLVETCN